MLKIIKGSDVDVNVQILEEETGEPFSLSDFTSASAFFPQEDSDEPLAIIGNLVSSDLGKLNFPMGEEQTALLEAGDSISIEVHVRRGTTLNIVQFDSMVSVIAQLF